MSPLPRRTQKSVQEVQPKKMGGGVGFSRVPLTHQKTVGEQLRLARLAQRKSLEVIGQKVRVSPKYLDALERGHYRDLPSLVYARHYTRLYAKDLGLPWKQLEQVYDQEIRVYSTHPEGSPAEQKRQSRREQVGAYQQAPLEIPKILKFGVIGIAILLIAVYFVWELVQFLSPPQLVILSPERDIIVTTRDIVVSGKTIPGALVDINGQTVNIEPDGSFTEEVYLSEGLNTLRVSARSKRSKEHVEIRHVLYEAQP